MKKYFEGEQYCRHCGKQFNRPLQYIDTCYDCEQGGHNPKNGAICTLCDTKPTLPPKNASEGLETPKKVYI